MRAFVQFLSRLTEFGISIANGLMPLMLRLALAVPFLKSGLTKWSGFLELSPSAEFLFEDEFKLHILGSTFDLPAPDLLALADGVIEIASPVFLIVGLATRLNAFVLLGMTGVIQLVVPDGWANFHLPWAAMAIAIIAVGPGRVSIDAWIKRHLCLTTWLGGAEPRPSST